MIPTWDFVIENWSSVLENNRGYIVRLLQIGIPDEYRGRVWSLLAQSERAKEKAGFEYRKMIDGDTQDAIVIDKDVPRTFGVYSHLISEATYKSLRNILIVYSKVDEEVGYVQGINFIAGMFLRFQDEETAFWSLYGLMFLSNHPHRNFFKRGFPSIYLYAGVLSKILEERFPVVDRAFRERVIDPSIFCPQWFMCSFLGTNLDFETQCFVFDQFIAYGVAPLFSFGLAIVDVHQKLITDGKFEEFLSAMTNPGNSRMMDSRHRLNMAWCKNWISTKHLRKYLSVK